jgi:hypothetical protein
MPAYVTLGQKAREWNLHISVLRRLYEIKALPEPLRVGVLRALSPRDVAALKAELIRRGHVLQGVAK